MIKREDQSAERNNVMIDKWKPQNQPEAREDESTWNVNTSVPALAKTLEKPIPINHASPMPSNEPTPQPRKAAIEPSIMVI